MSSSAHAQPATPSHPSLLPALSPTTTLEQTPAPLHTLPPHLQHSLGRPSPLRSPHPLGQSPTPTHAHMPHQMMGTPGGMHHHAPIPQPQFVLPGGGVLQHTPTAASHTASSGGNVFGVVMGNGPGQVPQPESNPKVYASVYSGIPVFEAMIRGISVMRRTADSWVNATQILKVAGIPKSTRTKILEKEVLVGKHEKVQGGYGKYQGTWIPFERGQELAAQYGVTSFLAPLFDFTPSPSNVAALPVTSQADRIGPKAPTRSMIGYDPGMNGAPGMPAYASIPQYHGGDMMMPPTPYGGDMYYMPPYPMAKNPGDMGHDRSHSADLTGLAPPANINGMGLPPSHADVYIDQYGRPHPTYHYAHANGDDMPPPAKRQRSDEGDMGDFLPEEQEEGTQQNTQDQEMQVEDDSDSDDGLDPSAVSLPFRLSVKPLRPKVGTVTARTRSRLINAFSAEEPVDLRVSLGLLDAESSTDIDIDMVIDDQGHTALHWAAALAKTSIIEQLIDIGADIHRGNYAGETPLIRAVLTTNHSEAGTFPALLNALSDSIKTIDHAHRSVIHHIALVAGVKGRAASARGYMAAILEFAAKESSELGLPLKALVNVQDVHGDTALNIAARVGSRALIQLLLDAGADKARANKLGLKPEDFGVEVDALRVSPGETVVASLKSEVPKPERRSRDVQKNISAIFETINETFAAEMTHKQTKLNATENSVRHATKTLAEKRQQVAQAQAQMNEFEQVKQRVDNVRKALSTLSGQDWTGRSPLSREMGGIAAVPSAFRFVQGVNPVKGSGEEAALPERGSLGALKRLRRVAAWEDRIANVLQDRLDALEGEGADKAVKYRKLVGLCTKVPVEKVDGLLDVLTQAIESDGSSLDQGRISGLLTRIKDGSQAQVQAA